MLSGSTNRNSDQLVAVTWADAHSLDTYEWKALNELDLNDGDYLIVSVGWMLPDEISKKNHVVLYQSRTPDGDLDHVLVIPQGMVRVIEKLSSYCGSRDAST
jgi:hypothetical protein